MLVYLTMLMVAGAMAVLVYRYDLYDREPLPLILLAMAMGFVAMHGVGSVEDQVMRLLRIGRGSPGAMAVTVAAIEDLAKLAVVVLLATIFRRHFNDPIDGLIYGTLAGIGAGVNESLLYLGLAAGAGAEAIGAEVIRLLAHGLMGGIIGFAVGLGARPGGMRERRPMLTAACVAMSMAMHFGWDYMAYTAASPGLAGRLALMAVMLGMIAAWGWMVGHAGERSRVVFTTCEVRAGRGMTNDQIRMTK